MVGLSVWRKRVQDMDSRADWIVVSCHYDACLEALKQKIIPALLDMEKETIKIDLHKKWVNKNQPKFALISKNTQETSSSDNSQKVQLKKSSSI